MAKTNEAWGIEVGANAIKAIHLALIGEQVQVVNYDVIQFKKVLTTPELNVDEAIQKGLEQLISRQELSGVPVVISVSGHMAFARFAKLPPVESKKIPDIVKFEAVQQIPFPIDQVEWDYQVFTQPDSPDVEVGIFAITKERLARVLANYRGAKLDVECLTLSPLAVYNAMCFDLDLGVEQTGGIVLMDVGTSSTDVVIVDGKGIWLRTLPIGGNHFTEALVRTFKLSFSKAEKLKREARTNKYARQIFQAMRPVFSDLVQEVQRSLGFYQSLNRDSKLEKLIGMGSTFRLPGLRKYLKQQLQIDVTRVDGFQKISMEGARAADFADRSLNLVTAYGLALQGLGLERVNANILPSSLIKQRLWASKQPMFAMAAALMMAAAGAAAAKYVIDTAIFEASLSNHAPRVASVTNEAEKNVQDWRKIEGGSDPRQHIENLRRILDYRDLWPKLLADISSASMALNPQEPLLHSPIRDHLAIPREERQRIYISSVDVGYVGGDTPEARAGGPRTVGSPAPSAPVQPRLNPDTVTQTTGIFLVTLKGYTPHRKGTELVANVFLKWFQDNANRPDRPYRLAISQDQIKVSTHSVKPGGGKSMGGAAPEKSGATGGSRQEPNVFDRPSGQGIDYRAFLPSRPTLAESRDKDVEFQITYRIHLLPPEQARQALTAAIQPATSRPTPQQPVGDKAGNEKTPSSGPVTTPPVSEKKS